MLRPAAGVLHAAAPALLRGSAHAPLLHPASRAAAADPALL